MSWSLFAGVLRVGIAIRVMAAAPPLGNDVRVKICETR